ncbi:MAG: DUF559 domain-containing protein, partial [Candidatus Sericytochromatia bacterium]|nr:DUF559 domain-containing protein [Candidatus Sericytochromatia bacterium]
KRDAWLAAEGLRVLRVYNPEVVSNLEGVREAILKALGATPHPADADPLPGSPGRGERVFRRRAFPHPAGCLGQQLLRNQGGRPSWYASRPAG